MSSTKKLIRKNFRDACYKRDGFHCAMCNVKSSLDKAEEELDAHHQFLEQQERVEQIEDQSQQVLEQLAQKITNHEPNQN